MIREIVTYDVHSKKNNEILHKKLKKVSDFQAKETLNCIRDLNDTLDDIIARQGNRRDAIGLSANQIDYDLAISAVTLKDRRYMLINPKLVKESGKPRLFRIGCFSVENYRAMVRYNDDVVIAYQDENGDHKELALQGDQSCVVQHEMDHLEGMLLFEKADDYDKDFFVPRETVYKDGRVPFNNHGLIFELERRQGLRKTITPTAWYSALFNDYTDYVTYVDRIAEEEKELLDTVRKYASEKGKILEAGCGTGALSVALSKEDHQVDCCGSDRDMLELAERIGEANHADVGYHQGEITKLPYEDKTAAVVFSYEVLETLDEEALSKALDEGLRVADIYIFKVPTIRIAANTLKGNERLRTERNWKKTIVQNGHTLLESRPIGNGGYLILVIK